MYVRKQSSRYITVKQELVLSNEIEKSAWRYRNKSLGKDDSFNADG